MTDKHISDGGPAFPGQWYDFQPCTGDQVVREQWSGVTLRDYFAASAIQGLLANPGGAIQQNGMSGWGWCNCTVDGVAEFAWHIADAMLRARESVQPTKEN